tara:strand:- start:771 stop:1175 length:405 start_codon:yes stop_codon:yes gene_type:complete
MEKEELRIGNFVLFGEDGTEFKVTGIYDDGLNVKNDHKETYIGIDAFEGIKLSEKNLLNFGFQYYKHSDELEINEDLYLIYTKCNTDKVIFIQSTGQDDDGRLQLTTIHPRCVYVHQLQNLYFALTGEELKIKP